MALCSQRDWVENEPVRDILVDEGIRFTDVRIIKDKMTGISKGFGFVDFSSVEEARRWMEAEKGNFRIGVHRIPMTYTTPRTGYDLGPPVDHSGTSGSTGLLGRIPSMPDVSTGDWICSRCSSHNFKRRECCYKCQFPRSQVQPLTNSVDGIDMIGTTPCNTLVLRCLDAMTTEDEICRVFHDNVDVKIRQCHVMRDEVTHESRCFAFAELPTVADAYKVMDTVTKQVNLFEIGGKAVTVSYAKNTFSTIMATLRTEGSYNAQLNSSRNLAIDLAQAAMASQYSGVSHNAVAQKAIAASVLVGHDALCGPAIAQAAIQQKQTEQHVISALAKNMKGPEQSSTSNVLPVPTFPFNASLASTTTYPNPDTSKYIYDETTKFFYDPITGLLYEPNSRYFYDRSSQSYYYWDGGRNTYFLVQQSTNETSQGDKSDKPNPPVSDSVELKVRVGNSKNAQQIAKEMEKWAKRMNSQKKALVETKRSEAIQNEPSLTADTGFTMFEAARNKTNPLAFRPGSDPIFDSSPTPSNLTSESEKKVTEEENSLIDWSKLACLLCSRGFKDTATLQKHKSFSSLHIENLNKLRAKHGLGPIDTPGIATANDQIPSSSTTPDSSAQITAQLANNDPTCQLGYRDRAKERREKYGIPSPPRSRYRQPPNHSDAPPVVAPITSFPNPPPPPPPLPQTQGPGSKLMEKMGWQVGQGLGRVNQGRTDIIEAEFRQAGVGLGAKTYKKHGPEPENYKDYKDNVKRAMYQRFHELN